MKRERRKVRMVVDDYTRLCLTAVVALLAVLVLGLWVERGSPCGAADGKTPFLDSAADRKEIAKTLEDSNAKMDELISLFKTGQAKVQIMGGAGGKDEANPDKP